jgi:putative membrane protein
MTMTRTQDPAPELDPRVYLAAERTTLAWIRTGLAMMGFGFVVARFGLFYHELAAAGVVGPGPGTGTGPVPAASPQSDLSLWVGCSLVLLGVWVTLAGAIRHTRFRRRFQLGRPFITPRSITIITLSTLLAALGIAMTVFLLLLRRP